MADIIDVVQADRSQIRRCQDHFSALSQRGSGPGFSQEQADTWDTLAGLIELHIRALDEICCLAIYRAGPDGPAHVRRMLDEHNDIRELLGETRLHSPGTPSWVQLTKAVLAAWSRQPGYDEDGILAGLHQVGSGLRQHLGRQWRAFITAQIRDQPAQATPQATRLQHPPPGGVSRPQPSVCRARPRA